MNPNYTTLQESPVMASVVIPMLENRDDTLGPILGVISRIEHPRMEPILVANLPARENAARSQVQLPGRPAPKFAVMSHNIGVGPAWNVGWQLAEGDVVVFLNDDCVPDVETLTRLCYTLMVDRPDVGIVGVEGHEFEWRDMPGQDRLNPGCCVGVRSWGIDTRRPHWLVPPVEGVETTVVTGHCFAMRREDLVALRGFDPRYAPFFCEDYGICDDVREKLGKKVLTIPGNVSHKIGVSNPGGGRPYLTGFVMRDPQIAYANFLWHRYAHPKSPVRLK